MRSQFLITWILDNMDTQGIRGVGFTIVVFSSLETCLLDHWIMFLKIEFKSVPWARLQVAMGTQNPG